MQEDDEIQILGYIRGSIADRTNLKEYLILYFFTKYLLQQKNQLESFKSSQYNLFHLSYGNHHSSIQLAYVEILYNRSYGNASVKLIVFSYDVQNFAEYAYEETWKLTRFAPNTPFLVVGIGNPSEKLKEEKFIAHFGANYLNVSNLSVEIVNNIFCKTFTSVLKIPYERILFRNDKFIEYREQVELNKLKEELPKGQLYFSRLPPEIFSLTLFLLKQSPKQTEGLQNFSLFRVIRPPESKLEQFADNVGAKVTKTFGWN